MKKAESISNLIELAKAVDVRLKKIHIAFESDRELPKGMRGEFEKSQEDLDQMLLSLLKKEKNLKETLIHHHYPHMSTDLLLVIQDSYIRVTTMTKLPDGRWSRIFLIPFIYWEEGGKNTGEIIFKGNKKDVLHSMLSNYVEESIQYWEPVLWFNSEDYDENHYINSDPESENDEEEAEIKIFDRNLHRCLILDEEEININKLHLALLNGTAFDESKMFSRRELLGNGDKAESGWTVGALPFSIIHSSKETLERADFNEEGEEFLNGFNDIFDPEEALSYAGPIIPNLIAAAGSRLLWQKQVWLNITEMLEVKTSKQVAVIESTCVMADEQMVAVIMNFEIGNQPDGHDEAPLSYHRRISRNALNGEEPSDLAAFLANIPQLHRRDFKLLMGFESVKN